MNIDRMKRVISLLLSMVLVLGCIPATAFAAEELCEHHQEHIGCSYAPAVEAAACTHECGDACYAEVENCIHVHEDCGTEENPCDHACSSENGCVTSQLNCTHTHGDCGYAEAVEEVPCDFVCAVCAEAASEAEGNQVTDPVCYCVEKCVEANIWCDVCSNDVSACGGSEEAVAAPLNVEKDAPVIHSVSVDKTQVLAGESVTVTMRVTDESELDEVHVTFDSPNEGVTNMIQVTLSKIGDNLYSGTLTTNDSFASGTYYAYYIVAQDVHGNRNQINRDESVYFELISDRTENKAPVINSVSLDKTQVKIGESVTVIMDVEDESELAQVRVTFEMPFAGVAKMIDVNLTQGTDGLYRGTLTTDDTYPCGTYYAYYIVAEDIYGNREQINSDKSVSFEVVMGGIETNVPVINSITLDKSQVVAGETVTVTVDVTDESELSDVHVSFDTPLAGNVDNRITVDLTLDESGFYIGTLTTDESFSNGNYYVFACVAKDIYGNRAQIQDKSVHFELSGGYTDANAPVINSVTLDKTKVTAGETVTITVDVEDESDISDVHVSFDTPLAGNVDNRITVDLTLDKDGFYRSTITTDETFANGNYYVYACVAKDVYGNRIQIQDKTVCFELSGGHSEVNAPMINSMTLDKTKVAVGETVTITVDIEDESDMSDVHVSFDTPLAGNVDNRITVDLTLDEDGLYRGTITTDETFPYGNYYVFACVAKDIYGNRTQIMDESVCFEYGVSKIETDAPVINKITVDKTQVVTGESVTVTMDVTDASELDYVYIQFDTPHAGVAKMITVDLTQCEDGLYRGTLTTDDTYPYGTYYAYYIVAQDVLGNREQINRDTSLAFELIPYKPAYTVTWNINGEKYDETKVIAGGSITAPDYTVPEGYFFSGWDIPDAMPDEDITLDAELTEITQQAAPVADFTATGYDTGILSNVTAGMQYSLDQGENWITVTADTVELTGLEPLSEYYDKESRIWVKMPGNGTTTSDSEIQKINVYRETAPSNVTAYGYYTITGVTSSMEYRKEGTDQWTKVLQNAMSLTDLEVGVYKVRTAATGKYLASEAVEVTVEGIPVYTITYKLYGGTINGEYAAEYTYGEGAQLPTDVTRDQFNFRGWSDSDKVFNKVTEIGTDASGDKTFYAWWEVAPYTITWTINGEFYAETAAAHMDHITAPDYLVPLGYSFSGWDIPDMMPAEDITLDAQLTMLKPESTPTADFTATGYDTGILSNVTAGMQYSLDQGENWITVTADTVELTGLEPLSEYYDKESRIWVKMPGDAITTSDSEIQKINVYRESKPANVTAYGYYTITGVTSSMEYRKEGADQWTRVPQNAMSLTDLEVGVYEVRTAATGKYLASDAVEVTVDGIPVYTITYKLYGGTINGEYAAEYTYGEGAQLPTDVTRDQFNFRGWSDSDKVFNQVTEIGTDASGDKTFYAWWEVAPYTITWTINGEFYVETAAAHMDHITAPDYLVPLGYTFSGWDIPDMMPAEDITLDATLTAETFKVTFTVNGEEYQQLSFLFGTAVTAPDYTVPEGYTFSGWDVPETMPAENIKLDATLTANKYKITWIVDDTKTEVEYTYGATIVAPEDPAKAGNRCISYSFKMWEGFAEGMTMPATDLEFTAVFDAAEKHIDWNRDHICDRKCGKTDIGEHADSATDRDHRCDYGCKAILEACFDKDGDRNHNCDICRRKNVSAHTYAEATCTKPATCTECGAKHGWLKAHTWNDGKVLRKPTCTKPGVMGFKCRDCHKHHIEMIKPDGHDWDNGKVIKKPTCTKDGVKIFRCKSCHETRMRKIEAIGHDYHYGVCEHCGHKKFGKPVYPGWWYPWWK